ncbi:hypothetical protein [Phyllobacterium chamaecytisi]|uniref:hypothetical protein n=1 Tax=Phyllobacterium chamaecytisi TaxID=2876082 RepID=UPI001CCF1115|nr:hypothetical protein [Phyllobacterium sp. KW56]MBZ9605027.1 hypothetical protein [Phyllobacterium sp. KW56]
MLIRKIQTRSASDWQYSLVVSFHTFHGILTIHATHPPRNQNLGRIDADVDNVGQENVKTVAQRRAASGKKHFAVWGDENVISSMKAVGESN